LIVSGFTPLLVFISEAAMALFYQSPTRNLPTGYTFRGATLNDIPVVAYLFNQRQLTFTNSGYNPIAEMRKEWQTQKFNPAMDVRLIFDQREHLIGYIEVWTTFGLTAHPWLWGCVHPDYENHGIGTALLRWAEARVRLAMEPLPENLRIAPRFGTQHILKTVPALCEALGWQIIHAEEGIIPQAKKLTSAAHLTQNANMHTNFAYDIYEKEIRSGDETFPEVV
jgi:GNAT superfamily N-acetyltransferase